MKKRIISMILALVMLFSVMPTSVFAAEGEAKGTIKVKVYLWNHEEWVKCGGEYTGKNPAWTDTPVEGLEMEFSVYSQKWSRAELIANREILGYTSPTDGCGETSFTVTKSQIDRILEEGYIIECNPSGEDTATHDSGSYENTYTWDWIDGNGYRGAHGVRLILDNTPEDNEILVNAGYDEKTNDNHVAFLTEAAAKDGFNFTVVCYVTPSRVVEFDANGGFFDENDNEKQDNSGDNVETDIYKAMLRPFSSNGSPQDLTVSPPAVPVKKEGFKCVSWVDESGEDFNFNTSIKENITLYAKWEPIECAITWVDGNDEILKTENVSYGTVPSYEGNTPTKDADAQYTYTFNNKWSPEIVPVTRAATYTAQFDSIANSYTVTFKAAEGATPVPTAQTVEYGQTATKPTEIPASAYYNVFNGWLLDGSAYDFSAPVTGSITLVADLGHECYDDNEDGYCDGCGDCLHPVGDNGYCAEKDCEHNANCDCHPDTTKGVRQIVIYTKFADGTPAANVPVQIMKNIKKELGDGDHVAVGTPVTTGPDGKVVIDNTLLDEITLNQDVYANVTGTAYGWADRSADLPLVRTAVAGDNTRVWPEDASADKSLWVLVPTGIGFNGEITLYVKELNYTVKFDANGGEGTMADQIIARNTDTALNENAFAKTGYIFAGWNTAADGSGDAYENKYVVNNLADAGATITLYAQWTVDQYTVTWIVDETSSSDVYDFGETVVKPADPEKVGYTFNGWGAEVPATMPAEDLTFIAQFTANTYEVTFDVNTGDELAEEDKTMEVTYDKPYGELPTPTKKGYTFDGWYLNDTTKIDKNSTVKTAEDHTLFAKWEPKSMIVTFDENLGQALPADQKTKVVVYDSVYGDLPTPRRDGYTFLGWFLGKEKITATTIVKEESDHTLVAHWARKPIPTTPTTKPTEPVEDEIKVERLDGEDRYETAIEIGAEGWDKADTILIASGENYPDALAGVPLSKKLDAPILLVKKNSVSADVIAEIERLDASKIIILGGPNAVSETVEKTLQRYAQVSRIWGQDRNGTAAQIAYKLGAKHETAFIVSNATFADALSSSSPAALMGAPILFANPNGTLPAETAAALKNIGCTKVFIVGGGAAVDLAVEKELKAMNISSERVYGNDRYLTSIAVYNKFNALFTSDDVSLATGKDFPDALTGAAFAAKKSMPVFLVANKASDTLINTLKGINIDTIYVFGGIMAVPQTVVDSIVAALTK